MTHPPTLVVFCGRPMWEELLRIFSIPKTSQIRKLRTEPVHGDRQPIEVTVTTRIYTCRCDVCVCVCDRERERESEEKISKIV